MLKIRKFNIQLFNCPGAFLFWQLPKFIQRKGSLRRGSCHNRYLKVHGNFLPQWHCSVRLGLGVAGHWLRTTLRPKIYTSRK
jgi:hypothetical protein